MEGKKDKKLLNYVKSYQIPGKGPKLEDKHVVVPLPPSSNKLKQKDGKSEKKKSENPKKVFKRKENDINKKQDKNEIKLNTEKKPKLIDYDKLLEKLVGTNDFLKEQLKRRENHINKYKKKYEDQKNIIKNLELILSELKEENKTKNKVSSNHNNKYINDIDYINDILASEFECQDIPAYEDDILYDDKLQEQLAINAVDQQIMDELYPNPDSMSYEQILQLEDNMGSVSKGLTKSQFDKLPSVIYDKNKYSENYQCIICMEEFQKQEKVKILPCGHIFHGDCIKEWLLKQKTCPFCKSEIG